MAGNAGSKAEGSAETLGSMDALCGWRDVRRTARNNTDDVPGRFFCECKKLAFDGSARRRNNYVAFLPATRRNSRSQLFQVLEGRG